MRFNHIFFALMGLSLLSAFVIPPQYTDRGRGPVQGVFGLVSSPARAVARRIYLHFHADSVVETRAPESIRQENDQLRQEVVRLQAEVDRLQKLDASWQRLGNLRSLCAHFPVSGGDPGGRDALVLGNSDLAGLRVGMAVLYDGGLAGRIDRVGPTGTHVQLMTDLGFRPITGSFIRFVVSEGRLTPMKISSAQPLVEGLGEGRLVIRNLTTRQVQEAGLQANDWVVLDDNDWPAAVKSVRLGRLVNPFLARKDAPQYEELRVEPESSLSHLSDVWVLTKN